MNKEDRKTIYDFYMVVPKRNLRIAKAHVDKKTPILCGPLYSLDFIHPKGKG